MTFESITNYPRGTLLAILKSAYSFDARCEACWGESWAVFDAFFYDRPQIAESCGLMTALNGRPVGFVSWNPTFLPERVEIGHNGILAEFKGRGLGNAQMREAVRRIASLKPGRIAVWTSEICVPAQHMYESAGFRRIGARENNDYDAFSGARIDYELRL